MKLRTLIVTIAVLAALSVIVFIAQRPEPAPSADARVDRPVVDRGTIEKAAKVRLTDAGKTVELVRQSDGTWHVPSYYDMPVDLSKLSTFVGNLTEAKLQRLVTSNPERIARLEFKDTKIELLDDTGKALASVTLGKNSETGGGRYVRFGDEQKAYLANLTAWLDPEPKSWANAELLQLKPDDVAKVEAPSDDGKAVTLSRAKKDDVWTASPAPEGQRVNADKIASVLSSLTTIRFTDTSALDDPNAAAAKAHLRTFKFTTFDNKTITVALGRKPEEKKLRPPAPTTDGKSGPAALGSVTDLVKETPAPKAEGANSDSAAKADASKPLAPEFETIPAGPVYAFIIHSDTNAPINMLMQKRAFQVGEYVFTSLPSTTAEWFEPAPPAPAPASAQPKS